MSSFTLLLAGIAINSMCMALILFVQYFADFAETYRILRWLMGDLDISSYEPLLTALPLVVVSFAIFAWLARPPPADQGAGQPGPYAKAPELDDTLQAEASTATKAPAGTRFRRSTIGCGVAFGSAQPVKPLRVKKNETAGAPR